MSNLSKTWVNHQPCYLKLSLLGSTKASWSNAFAYFSILKLVYLCNTKVSIAYLSKNCNIKVSVANFSAPNKPSLRLFSVLVHNVLPLSKKWYLEHTNDAMLHFLWRIAIQETSGECLHYLDKIVFSCNLTLLTKRNTY